MAPGLVVAVVAVSCSGAAALCQSAGSQAGLETGNPPIRNVSSSSSGRQPRGNPLWAIPLSSLSATRERPIFLPSRRPPAPVVIASPPPPMRSLPPPSQPERPALALVGTLIGEDRGIAILLDQTTRNFLRLHTGEDHLGWTLRSVHGREAVLQKQLETIHLLLPAPGEQSPPAAQGTQQPKPGLAVPPVPAPALPPMRQSVPVAAGAPVQQPATPPAMATPVAAGRPLAPSNPQSWYPPALPPI